MYKFGLLFAVASGLLLVNGSVLTEKELQELKDAPLVPIKITDAASPGRSLSDTIASAKKKCQCQGKGCGCCVEFEVYFVSVEGCANFTIFPKEKAFQVSLSAAGKHIFKHKISAVRLQKLCSKVANINDLEICLFTTLDEEKHNEIVSCMSVDMKYKGILLVNVNFHCLKYANDELTFIDNEKTEKDAIVNLHIKNPFHLIAKLIKAALNQLEEVPA